MYGKILMLTKVELYKMSRLKYSYFFLLFIIANAIMVGIGSKVFPAIIAAVSGTGGASIDGWTFASILASGTFHSAGAGTVAMLGFSASLIASETDTGTLKNILVRPVERSQFILAKAQALFIYCLIIVLVMAVICIGAGALFYGLGDVTLPETGEVYRTSSEMFMNMGIMLTMDLFTIFTAGCMGLLISTIVNNSGWAVITSVVIYFPVMFLKNFDIFRPWIFTSYMDLGQNILREMVAIKSKTWTPDIYSFFAVSIVTIVVFLGLSIFVFKRKEIN